ncbi:uncharacterized protein [Medicago truncatula]|uniref:uncharacterized protein n=1 Tax=Medicago truncatula TaxID=3880 RepID=UPI0019684DC8|nr:uncharacterized protein LOC120577518 [Medicago truncatula]
MTFASLKESSEKGVGDLLIVQEFSEVFPDDITDLLPEREVEGKYVDFKLDENDVLMFHDRVCVPHVLELKKQILEEGHKSSLSIHLGVTKMYQDLKKLFWWPGMKKDILEFVYACLSAHFVPIKTCMSVTRLVEIYIEQIVRLHDIPSSIVSDQDLRFTSKFWESL